MPSIEELDMIGNPLALVDTANIKTVFPNLRVIYLDKAAKGRLGVEQIEALEKLGIKLSTSAKK